MKRKAFINRDGLLFFLVFYLRKENMVTDGIYKVFSSFEDGGEKVRKEGERGLGTSVASSPCFGALAITD